MADLWGTSPASSAGVWWALSAGGAGIQPGGCVFQAGVSSHESPWRDSRDCRPHGGAGPPALPEDDSLLPGSAKSGMAQPDFSQSSGGALRLCSYTAVEPERSPARPAQALASEHVPVCARPRVSRKA